MRLAIGVCLACGTAAAEPSLAVKGHVAVKLSTIQAAIDAAVPQNIDQLGAWQMAGSVGYRFGMWRDPIQVSTGANALVAATHVAYGVGACVSFGTCHEVTSCGVDPPHATLDAQLSASAKWKDDWTLEPKVSLHTVEGTPCKLSRVKIDASAVVLAALQPALQAGMALFGRSIDVRGYAEQLWARVPATQLGPELWLAWNVAHVVVGPIQYGADAVGSDVELDVVPRLVEGQAAPANGPLPDKLETTASPAPHTLGLELVAAWPDLDAMVQSSVGTLSVGGTDIKVLHVHGSDGGIVIELEKSATKVTAELAYDDANDDRHATNVRVGDGTSMLDKAIASRISSALHVHLRPLLAEHLQRIDQALAAAHVDHPSLTAVEQHVSITSAGVKVELVIAGALAIPAPRPT